MANSLRQGPSNAVPSSALREGVFYDEKDGKVDNKHHHANDENNGADVQDPIGEQSMLLLAVNQAKLLTVSHETKAIFDSLQNCLNLRDKYMAISRQRLGDNPKDFDGEALPPGVAAGDAAKFSKWQICPKPPPPRWHWRPKPHNLTPAEIEAQETDEFEFSQFDIPGPSDLRYELDKNSVYQVYEGGSNAAIKCSNSHSSCRGKLQVYRGGPYSSGLLCGSGLHHWNDIRRSHEEFCVQAAQVLGKQVEHVLPATRVSRIGFHEGGSIRQDITTVVSDSWIRVSRTEIFIM